MAKKYSVTGPSNSQAAPATILSVTGSTAIRPRLYDFLVGSSTTPADQDATICVGRVTSAGTNTSFTPVALDPADVAAVCTAGITHTAEPTGPVNLLQFAMNQRASFRWVAAPDSEIVGAATASNGVSARMSASSATMVMNGSGLWFE